MLPLEAIPRRDCDEPHDAEVYAIDDLTTDAENYPGMDVVASDIERILPEATCRADRWDRTSRALATGITHLFPSDESWEQGDRRSTACMVIQASMARR